ncbi:MAG: hypothetical protein ACXVIP_03150 [Halobacteriota archaeon]
MPLFVMIKSKQFVVFLPAMEFITLSEKEQEFLCRVRSYVEGDTSRPLFYMDIDALAREVGVNKDDIYAISQTLAKHGLVEVKVAGYLEVVMVKLTPSGDAYVKSIKKR